MNSDTEDVITDEKEKQILRLIKRIKKDRNRPSYQSILSFANREENKMDMDELKSILDKMIAENIIKNIGVNGKVSFSIVEEKMISSDTVSTNTQTYSENIGDEISKILSTRVFFDTITNIINQSFRLEVLRRKSTNPYFSFGSGSSQTICKQFERLANIQ